MSLDAGVLATILGMAAVTYLTRIAGFWIVRSGHLGPRATAALDAMPGVILVALVAPVALAGGPAETAAAAITLLLARRLAMIPAMIGGIASVVLLRGMM